MTLGIQHYGVAPQLQSENSSPGIHDYGCHGPESQVVCMEIILVRLAIQVTFPTPCQPFYSELSLWLH